MRKRLSPLVVGAFVLGALLLAAVALLSFGARHFFSEPYRFVVLIDEGSISGLDVGSAVKLSGVRVGRVESVTARFDRELGTILIRVECDFYEEAAATMLDNEGASSDGLMRELILGGLHAKLNFSGITGLLYMDLVIEPAAPDAGPAEIRYEKSTGYPIVPMAPSLLAEFTDAFSSIANGLARVDYPGISTQLKEVLTNLNHALAGVNLGQTTGRIEAAASAIETLAADPEIRAAVATLHGGLQDLRTLIGTWRDASPGLQEDLTATLDTATAALAEFQQVGSAGRSLLETRRDLPNETAATLLSLQRAADAVERLADYLERNPGALLRGRADNVP